MGFKNWLWIGVFSLFFCQFSIPGFPKFSSINDLRSELEGMDSPTCFERIYLQVRENPKLLEEVVLLKDPKNFYGRSNGTIMLAKLAIEKKISMENYFNVIVTLLSEVNTSTLPEFFKQERSDRIGNITGFGCKPYKEVPIYKGVHSSIGFFIIYLKTLPKYNMIKNRDMLDEMLGQLSEIKNDLEKNGEKNNKIALQKLQVFLQSIEHRKDDFTTDSFEVVTVFTKNIISQLENPSR